MATSDSSLIEDENFTQMLTRVMSDKAFKDALEFRLPDILKFAKKAAEDQGGGETLQHIIFAYGLGMLDGVLSITTPNGN